MNSPEREAPKRRSMIEQIGLMKHEILAKVSTAEWKAVVHYLNTYDGKWMKEHDFSLGGMETDKERARFGNLLVNANWMKMRFVLQADQEDDQKNFYKGRSIEYFT